MLVGSVTNGHSGASRRERYKPPRTDCSLAQAVSESMAVSGFDALESSGDLPESPPSRRGRKLTKLHRQAEQRYF